jgi:hypothetical protein
LSVIPTPLPARVGGIIQVSLHLAEHFIVATLKIIVIAGARSKIKNELNRREKQDAHFQDQIIYVKQVSGLTRYTCPEYYDQEIQALIQNVKE